MGTLCGWDCVGLELACQYSTADKSMAGAGLRKGAPRALHARNRLLMTAIRMSPLINTV